MFERTLYYYCETGIRAGSTVIKELRGSKSPGFGVYCTHRDLQLGRMVNAERTVAFYPLYQVFSGTSDTMPLFRA